jgi:hypothetical protein
VTAGRRDLECTARLRLTAHLREIDGRGGRRLVGRCHDVGRRPRPSEERDRIRQRLRADDLEPLDLCSLDGVRGWHDDPVQTRSCGGDRHAEDAGRRQELALQRDLAGEDERAQTIVRDLTCRREDAHDEREIQSGTFLPNVRRREVDDDTSQWPFELGAFDRGPDPFPCVLHAGSGKSRDDEGGEPATHVRLHDHEMPADAEHRHPQDPSVHERRTIPRTTDTARRHERSR